jgi:predicted nucleic acid-binding protein
MSLNDSIEMLAATLIESDLKPLDALHLAFAAHGEVEYFCTCDDKLRRKAKGLESLKVSVVSPLELVDKVVE